MLQYHKCEWITSSRDIDERGDKLYVDYKPRTWFIWGLLLLPPIPFRLLTPPHRDMQADHFRCSLNLFPAG